MIVKKKPDAITNDKIHLFYAVTISGSLYRISDQIDKKTHYPKVKKLALIGKSAIRAGRYLHGGTKVGITPDCGILLFFPDKHDHSAYYCSTDHWGGGSSPIVGLFVDEMKARECLTSENLQKWDARWETETNAVILQIGNEHSIFVPEQELIDRAIESSDNSR